MTQFYDSPPERAGGPTHEGAGLPQTGARVPVPPPAYPRRPGLPPGNTARRVAGNDPYALQEPPPAVPPAPESPTDRIGYFLREMLQIALPAIILAIVVHLFLAQATVVFGQSMEPNLSPHQRLIVDKFSYRLNSPQRNDIVVIDLPNMDDMLVKRIVGLPGETIEIRDGAVLVDGTPLPEPFPHDLGHTSMAPLALGPLEYFVMGDNRDNSNDSRSFGPVHRESIVGRVWLRYWPLDDLTLF